MRANLVCFQPSDAHIEGALIVLVATVGRPIGVAVLGAARRHHHCARLAQHHLPGIHVLHIMYLVKTRRIQAGGLTTLTGHIDEEDGVARAQIVHQRPHQVLVVGVQDSLECNGLHIARILVGVGEHCRPIVTWLRPHIAVTSSQ